MSRKSKWKYVKYLGSGHCPKCGLPGHFEEGTIMGASTVKVDHRLWLKGGGYFTFKTCYPSSRKIWDPPIWYPSILFTKQEAQIYRNLSIYLPRSAA